MHILSIELDGAFTHAGTRVELPERGIVTVSGPNGSGKSGLVEAPASAVFGKTLRGTPPWVPDAKARIVVEAQSALGRIVVKRTKTPKGRPQLHVELPDGGEWPAHLRARDGDGRLAELFGSLAQWQRTHVFSASDAATFMTTTDGECKRLLEGMLGLDVFDVGSRACRAAIGELEKSTRELAQKAARLEERVEAEQRRLAEAERDASEHTAPVAPPDGYEAKLEAKIAAATEEEARLSALRSSALGELDALRERRTALATEVRIAEAARKRAEEHDECPECGQSLPPGIKVAARAAYAEARDRSEEHSGELAERISHLDDVILGHDEALAAARKRQRELENRLATARWEREAAELDAPKAAKLAERVKEARGKLVWLEEELDAAVAAQVDTEAALAVQRAADRVLGLRGARVDVLAEALGGIEESANAWLDRLFPGCTLHFAAHDETAKGVPTNTIARRIEGLAHGYGYAACSSGQRRRIDIAVLLALAEVAAGSGEGGELGDGTLFFDEVLDAIDDEGGLDAAVAVLEALAFERCVVVISHRADLLARLDAVARLRVEGGRVS